MNPIPHVCHQWCMVEIYEDPDMKYKLQNHGGPIALDVQIWYDVLYLYNDLM